MLKCCWHNFLQTLFSIYCWCIPLGHTSKGLDEPSTLKTRVNNGIYLLFCRSFITFNLPWKLFSWWKCRHENGGKSRLYFPILEQLTTTTVRWSNLVKSLVFHIHLLEWTWFGEIEYGVIIAPRYKKYVFSPFQRCQKGSYGLWDSMQSGSM